MDYSTKEDLKAFTVFMVVGCAVFSAFILVVIGLFALAQYLGLR